MPAEDQHLDDLRLVAAAYRRERVAGHGDREAYHAALAAYLEQNPHVPADKAGETVSRLIFEASEKAPDWLHGRDEA
jgi:hypothetical protein